MIAIERFNECNTAAMKALYDLLLYARLLGNCGFPDEADQLLVLAKEIQVGIYGMESAFSAHIQDGFDAANQQTAFTLRAILDSKKEA